MANFPGPYECRFNYTTVVNSVSIEHQQKLSLDITGDPDYGDNFINYLALLSDGSGTQPLDFLVDKWADACVAFYQSGGIATWTGVELWRYTFGTYDAEFISARSFSKAGTSASAIQEAAQSIVTFRTTQGGIFKLSFMESVIAPGNIDPRPFTNAALDALVDDVIDGGEYPWIAKDNGWPFAVLRHFPGQNEALWKKRRRVGV